MNLIINNCFCFDVYINNIYETNEYHSINSDFYEVQIPQREIQYNINLTFPNNILFLFFDLIHKLKYKVNFINLIDDENTLYIKNIKQFNFQQEMLNGYNQFDENKLIMFIICYEE